MNEAKADNYARVPYELALLDPDGVELDYPGYQRIVMQPDDWFRHPDGARSNKNALTWPSATKDCSVGYIGLFLRDSMQHRIYVSGYLTAGISQALIEPGKLTLSTTAI